MTMFPVAASVIWPRTTPLMATSPSTKITPLKVELYARLMGNTYSPLLAFAWAWTFACTLCGHCSHCPLPSVASKSSSAASGSAPPR